MTTLAEARDQIHRLTERRLAFLARRDSGELVRRFVAQGATATWVRGDRDRVLDVPARHGAILAAEFQVDQWRMLEALTAVLRAFCTWLANGTDAPPELREDPPEPPVMKLSGYFPSYVDNEWATPGG
jgi:hypothetical protein